MYRGYIIHYGYIILFKLLAKSNTETMGQAVPVNFYMINSLENG